MEISFHGYDESFCTFLADETVDKEMLVKIVANGTVGKCNVGDDFCGLCVGVRDGFSAIQLRGFIVVKTDRKIPLGYQRLVAGASGTVLVKNTGREYLVVQSTEKEVGFIL